MTRLARRCDRLVAHHLASSCFITHDRTVHNDESCHIHAEQEPDRTAGDCDEQSVEHQLPIRVEAGQRLYSNLTAIRFRIEVAA